MSLPDEEAEEEEERDRRRLFVRRPRLAERERERERRRRRPRERELERELRRPREWERERERRDWRLRVFLFGQSAWKWFALEPRMPIFLQIWQSYGGSFLPRPSRLVRELRRFRERERDRPIVKVLDVVLLVLLYPHGIPALRLSGYGVRRHGSNCNAQKPQTASCALASLHPKA